MTPIFSLLGPSSVGVYQALNVPGLLAIAPGGVHDAVPQNVAYPFVLYAVSDEDASSFGARPGMGPGSASIVRVRASAYSQYAGMKEAQAVIDKVTELLRVEPTIPNAHCWAIFKQPAIPVGDELIAGVPVKELAAEWLMYVEEA